MKSKTIKSLLRIFISASVLTGLIFIPLTIPTTSKAVENSYFGGQFLFASFCSCQASFVLSIRNFETDENLSVIYVPGYSLLWPLFNIKGLFLIGSYDKDAGICAVQHRTSDGSTVCIPLPADGLINNSPGVGTFP